MHIKCCEFIGPCLVLILKLIQLYYFIFYSIVNSCNGFCGNNSFVFFVLGLNFVFLQIEDHGFSSSFFPFIVAEEDVCSEIRMLEGALEFTERDEDVEGTGKSEAKNQAMDFIHEMGWLLHRSQLKCRLGDLDPNTDVFSFRRFKWLMDFSLDHEWCAVVNKLLNILLSGVVGTGEHSSIKLALSEMGILHRAVRRNSRPLVELLLRYVPQKTGSWNRAVATGASEAFLFRPDVPGPAGLTPLHIAAGKDGSEDVLDALTDDPEMVIISTQTENEVS